MDKKIVRAYRLEIASIMRYASTEPKHGLTENELRKYFGDLIMAKFGKWIDGQTCMVTEDRQVIVYPEDIRRFVGLVFDGRKTYWD